MKKKMKILIAYAIVMAIITVICGDLLVKASNNVTGSGDDGKIPYDYGILRAYHAEKTEYKPPIWNTAEQLGIKLGEEVKHAKTETYVILIVDEEKALPWIREGDTPYLKYKGKFYLCNYLNVDYVLVEANRLKPQIILGLSLGWTPAVVGAVILVRRKPK